MKFKVTFQPKSGGAPFDVQNVKAISWGARRHPRENGEVGQVNHQIDIVTIVREKALAKDGKNKNETEIIALAAAIGQKAYFKGTVVITPTAAEGAVQQIEWEQGHICDIQEEAQFGGNFVERLQIAVTGLKVDDSTFMVSHTT